MKLRSASEIICLSVANGAYVPVQDWLFVCQTCNFEDNLPFWHLN